MKLIVEWLRDTFLTEYIIARQEVVAWMVYPRSGDFKKVHIYGETEIVAKSDEGWLRHHYTQTLNHGYKMRKPFAYLYLKWLEKTNSTKMVFRMMPLSKAIFITDLTGLSEN